MRYKKWIPATLKVQKPKAKSQSPFSGLLTSKFLGVHKFCTKSRFFCTKSKNFCTKSKYFCTKSKFSVLIIWHFTVQICGSPNISVQSPNISVQSPNISVQSPNISVQSPNFLYKSRMGPNNLDFVQVQKMTNSAVQIFLYKVQIFLYKVQIFLYKVQILRYRSQKSWPAPPLLNSVLMLIITSVAQKVPYTAYDCRAQFPRNRECRHHSSGVSPHKHIAGPNNP